MYIKSKEILYIFKELADIFSRILSCALKSCCHYVQNDYSLKQIVPLEQVEEAGPPLESNSIYATVWKKCCTVLSRIFTFN